MGFMQPDAMIAHGVFVFSLASQGFTFANITLAKQHSLKSAPRERSRAYAEGIDVFFRACHLWFANVRITAASDAAGQSSATGF